MGYEIDVLQVGIACLFIIGIGFCLSKFEILTAAQFKTLGKFNSNVPFPFLLFRSMASKKLREITFMPLANSLLMSSTTQALIAICCAIFPFKDKLYTYMSTVVSSVYINYIIIGLPIFHSIWGTEYDHIAGICTFTHYVLLVPVFLVLAQLWRIKQNRVKDGESDPENLRITLKDVGNAFLTALKTPLLIGNIVGLIWSAVGIDYPIFPKYLGKYVGDLVVVFALIGIGRFLQVHSILACDWKQLVCCLFIRFFVCPGFSLLYAKLLNMQGTLARQCTILSALPAANAGFVLGNSVGIGADITSSMVFWTLILILPVLIFWFFIMDHFNIFTEEA